MKVHSDCADGTIISSDVEEVNGLLQKEWVIIEYGVVTFILRGGGINYNPSYFAFRLKPKNSSKIYEHQWKDIMLDPLPMNEITEVKTNEENIYMVCATTNRREKDKLLDEGWSLLDERRVHSESGTIMYTVIL